MERALSADRPLYQQVADDLRGRIEGGELAPGMPLPTEVQLAESHGVSRQTARLAVQSLVQQGLVSSRQGRGHHVRSYSPLRWQLSDFESGERRGDDPAATVDAWAAEVRAQGREPYQEIEVVLQVPPAAVRERLQLEEGESVVLRRRVRYVDKLPFQLSESYFPMAIAQGTMLMEPRDVSAPGGVLSFIGHPQTRYLDEIAVRMPSKAESDRLEIATGTPVAEVTRTGYDAEDVPVRVMVTVAPGDRHTLVYEMTAA